MSERERDIDAAEKALGTLPDGEARESADDLRRREAWEMRLAPLMDPIEPVHPPADLFARIEQTLDHEETLIELLEARSRVSRWRTATVAMTAAAAALAIWIAIPQFSPAPRYVAVVTADAGGETGMIIQFDTGSGIATVIPAGAVPPPGGALEMWHLPVGAEQPYSLGLLPGEAQLRREIEAGVGDVFAISFEPQGGSPTGQPTDPRYHGRIVRVD